MTQYLKGITIVLAFCASFSLHAQDPHFSQYYANPLYLNPAFAGVKKCPKLNLNYRNQYPQYGVYQTYSASYDQYVEGIKGGLGIMLLRDAAGGGALDLTEVSAIYSYHLQVTRKFTMLAGFQATFRQRQLDWGKFTFPDQIDQFYGFVKPTNEVQPGNNTNNHLDLSVGFLGFTENFYMGVTANHLTQPNEAFLSNNTLPLKLTAHAGASIPIGRRRLHNSIRNIIIPNVVYQLQGTAQQTTLGVSFNRGPISGGLAWRQGGNNPDAVIIILGLAPQNMPWTFGYSYDYTISDYTNIAGGAHEISLSYLFPCRIKKKGIKEIKCPTF
jgi:type IX secretion system PorP/SprF family membrane protein